MHRKVAGVIAAMVVFGAAGCGEDDPLTRAELVRQADAICTQMSRQTGAVLTEAGRKARGKPLEENPELAADLLAKFKRYRDEAATKLEGLEPAEELQARYDEYVAGIRESTRLLPTVESIQTGEDPNVRAREAVERENQRLSRAIGFKSCS